MDLKTKLFLCVEGIHICNVPVHFKQPLKAGWGTKAPLQKGGEEVKMLPGLLFLPRCPGHVGAPGSSMGLLHAPARCQVTSSPRLCCSQE